MKRLVSKKWFVRLKKVLANNKGFTLVELMVVLVIMAIFSGIAIATFSGTIGTAKKTAITANARSAYTAAQTIATKTYAESGFPTTGANVGVIVVLQDAIEAVMGRQFEDSVSITAESASSEGESMGGNLTTFEYTEDGITVILLRDGTLVVDSDDGDGNDNTEGSPPPA